MNTSYTLAALAAGLLAVALPAARAQTMHKCVHEGKTTYGDQPCEAGADTVLPAPYAPKADPGAASDLKRQRREAAALEKARHQREDLYAREQAKLSAVADARQKKCAKLALAKRWADEDARNASVPRRDSAQQRARRAGDTLALECPR
ncbi:DUF4124 domain-containing protein [Oxalobacteraceae bacterium A2-2]